MARGHRSSRGRRAPRPRRNLKPLWITLGLLGVVAVVLGVLLARDAQTARTALDDAANQARDLQDQITDGDVEGARATLAALQESTATAVSHTDGPLWGTLGATPFVGDSVNAVRTISQSLQRIADDGMPPVVDVAASLDADVFKPVGGRIDLAALTELAPNVVAAGDVLATERKVIDAIEADDVLGALKSPVRDLQDKIADAQTASDAAARAMRLLPSMLGGAEPRTYLLLFQNNAEIRSTGGIPGAFAVVRAEGGSVSIQSTAAGTSIEQFDVPVLELSADEQSTYNTLMAIDFRDTNFTPDFPRTAQLAATMLQQAEGVGVDGVISIDPVALSYVLRGLGPVQVPDGSTVTAENAVDVLLNEVYAKYEDPQEQDLFFAATTSAIFDRLTSGQGDSRTVLEGLADATDEGRVMVWATRNEEQALVADTRVSGAFLTGKQPNPQAGVYVNGSTASKMQYYLDLGVRGRSVRCTDDGVQTIEVTATFTSTAPADAADLPRYIAGTGQRIAPGSQILDSMIFGPDAGTFVSMTVDGAALPLSGNNLFGRPGANVVVRLDPGQTSTVVATMQTAKDRRGDVVLSRTPGVRSADNHITVESSC